MLSQNNNALGIIFPNSYDNTVPELVTERAMASIPFAGRYRMVDFMLSSMANCGISNVSIVVRKNYHSLMDHLGTGREWDMARRHGGLNIVPPFAEKGVRIYSGRVEALGSILSFLENQKERYVVMSDANIAINYDFNALLAAHQASGADVTIAYQKTEIPEGRKNDNYTLTVDADGRVTSAIGDMAEPALTIAADGGVTAPDTVRSKLELGDSYGMRNASSLGKEWYEHSEGYCSYLKGKTEKEVADIPADGSDADLAALCTISIDALQKAAGDAFENASL